jgi:hypothetical protein
MTLIKWGQLNIEWNKEHLHKMQDLAKELQVIGLEVSEIIILPYGYKLTAKLPKNPTSTLLYDKT